MKPYKTLTKEFTVNNKELIATIRVYCHQDDICLDDIIGDAENKEELEEKIASGRLFIGVVEVKASFGNFTGTDCLGGCYIESSQDIDDAIENYAMIDEAITELKNEIVNTYDSLKAIFEK